ncbi:MULTISPECIES: hypothetical protein [unclassified Nocardiopsis]|uniref:hypothetical protein n=1 Tax=Nocardiopsis TaxID=2013 RepID=UPI00387B9299
MTLLDVLQMDVAARLVVAVVLVAWWLNRAVGRDADELIAKKLRQDRWDREVPR